MPSRRSIHPWFHAVITYQLHYIHAVSQKEVAYRVLTENVIKGTKNFKLLVHASIGKIMHVQNYDGLLYMHIACFMLSLPFLYLSTLVKDII